MKTLLLTIILLSASILIADDHASKKAILVTGASSGIGKSIAMDLAKRGYYVFAGARKDKDLKALDANDNMEGIRLDVTKQDDINAAVKQIEKRGYGLYGLVNNAGVAILDPLIEVSEKDMDFLFDVNVYGPYRVTMAMAPLLIESKGRIVTIGSISGILSGTFFGPYSMSKHAMEAYTDALAMEMAKFDVGVTLVQPGNYRSKIGESMVKRREAMEKAGHKSLYGDDIKQMLSRVGSRQEMRDPQDVADAVAHAMDAGNTPYQRYMVVPNKTEAGWTIRKALQELVELNHDQAFSYDRAELIRRLDTALSSHQ